MDNELKSKLIENKVLDTTIQFLENEAILTIDNLNWVMVWNLLVDMVKKNRKRQIIMLQFSVPAKIILAPTTNTNTAIIDEIII